MPAHLLAEKRLTQSPSFSSPIPVRPTPRQIASSFGLSALSIKTPTKIVEAALPPLRKDGETSKKNHLGEDIFDEERTSQRRSGANMKKLSGGLPEKSTLDATIVKDDAPSSSSSLPTMEELQRKTKEPEQRRESEMDTELSFVDDELKKQSEEELLMLTELLKVDVAPPLTKESVIDVTEPETLVSLDPAPPSTVATPAKANNAITLSNWSLVIVPNNSMVTKLEKSLVEDWIVLVGRRNDMTEMWHSSLVTGRLANRSITTGSGRLYHLEGPLDSLALMEMGFTTDAVEAFGDGFPENWQMLLIQELAETRKDEPVRIKELLETKYERSARPKEGSEIQKEGPDRLMIGTKERGEHTKGMTTPRPRKKSVLESEESKENVSTRTEIILKHKKGERRPISNAKLNKAITPSPHKKFAEQRTVKRRRKSEPVSRWRDVHEVSPNEQLPITGRTRSGRQIVAPLAYWENQYLRLGSTAASPLNAIVKRKWDRLADRSDL
jgi:hypothetical protein